MKVIALGGSRTGSSSMCAALQRLIYAPYHMTENMMQPDRFFPLWEEALLAKYQGKGKSFGMEEFDKIFGEHDVSSRLSSDLMSVDIE